MDLIMGFRSSDTLIVYSLSNARLHITKAFSIEGEIYDTGRKVFMVLVMVLALGGCQAMTGRTAGQTVDDASITTAVKTKLAADKVSSLTRIDVDTTRGTVYLNGVVESPDQKVRAEEIASQVGGINGVVNNLQVQRRSDS